MRKQGLIFLIVVAALVVFISSVVADRWLELLMKRKFVVEDFDMQGLCFGTPRKTDGALSEDRKIKVEEQKLQKEVEEELRKQQEKLEETGKDLLDSLL